MRAPIIGSSVQQGRTAPVSARTNLVAPFARGGNLMLRAILWLTFIALMIHREPDVTVGLAPTLALGRIGISLVSSAGSSVHLEAGH
jgi:hypothetical protein